MVRLEVSWFSFIWIETWNGKTAFFLETCLLLTYSTNKFPTEYVPTVFDNYAVDLVIAEKSYTLALFDTGNHFTF